MKIPEVYYDFFSAANKLLDWNYEHVIYFFERQLVRALSGILISEKSLRVSDSMIERFNEICKRFEERAKNIK